VKRKSTIPDDPLDQFVPPASASTATAPASKSTPAGGRHKLTTYLTADQYRWALQASSAAKQDGYPLSIADVVRAAVDHLRDAPIDELRRTLGLTSSTERW